MFTICCDRFFVLVTGFGTKIFPLNLPATKVSMLKTKLINEAGVKP